ncbi:hypothetical protein GCM10023091_13660 [Ravibacter arvi]|uniref:Tetratricopeptide repeat protein n=1 Tax=Ravibacter arvi TaxID=2051041 RepID=A0ABP8LT22_9BACT
MNIILLPLSAYFVLMLTGTRWFQPVQPADPESLTAAIPVCGASVTDVTRSEEGRYVTALPGWGNHSYAVATDSDSSQYFFDQGLSLYYGYHFPEAVASFKESARFDPDNAMAYWGQALSMGPSYNGAHLYQKPAGLTEILAKMNRKAVKSPANELRLIGAMNRRYSEDPTDQDRPALNRAYAEALKKIVETDDEAKILYVDAVMLLHPWDFWTTGGAPQPWTQELVAYTNDVIRRNPDHPAALHYHIHLTEASRQPQVALESAHRLKDLMPGVAHMVHMSSHQYERIGLYPLGVEVNIRADSNLRVYDEYAKHLGLNRRSFHYFAVQTYCAFTGGLYPDALRYAGLTRASVTPSPENTYHQYLFMLPVLANVRMGKWSEILNDTTQIRQDWSYAGLLSDFAKGVASVYTNDLSTAAGHLKSLREKLLDPALETRRIPFNSSLQSARIAEKLLEGILLYAQKKPAAALASLEKAVQLEDQLIYTEPKDWPLPSRQFLGAYLLREGQARRAEAVYRADLAKNPGNGWSLTGLKLSLEASGRPGEAGELTPRVLEAFSHATEKPIGSVFME